MNFVSLIEESLDLGFNIKSAPRKQIKELGKKQNKKIKQLWIGHFWEVHPLIFDAHCCIQKAL